MDCFYAAIEIRDNPQLAHLPVAVGSPAGARGVICTCNYIARKFNVRSAMATAYAKRLCPQLIVLPVDMQKYREVAAIIQRIFYEFTPLVEPLSLDEAYLDVTNSPLLHGSATLIAKAICQQIWNTVQLTASAGVAPNKFLAKVASGWKKPNGLFVIPPQHVAGFIKNLPIEELFGVGKITAKKLHQLGLRTCADLQKLPLSQLIDYFGKFGNSLHEQCYGRDSRLVEPNRIRKSVGIEKTFDHDIPLDATCITILSKLFDTLMMRIKKYAADRQIKNQSIKIKLNNFKQVTLERASSYVQFSLYEELLFRLLHRQYGKIRLMGIGVQLA